MCDYEGDTLSNVDFFERCARSSTKYSSLALYEYVSCLLMNLRTHEESEPSPAPSRWRTGLAGVSTHAQPGCPTGGATSCNRKAAPLTY